MSTTFGIEIEFVIGPDYYSQSLVTAKLEEALGRTVIAAGYTHQNISSWKVVSDRSINGTGHELVSPVLTEARMGEIDTVCRVLADIGAKVNRSCGLHVHVGLRRPSAVNQPSTIDAAKRLALFYAHYEGVIDQLLPPSRRGNDNAYARSLKTNMHKEQLVQANNISVIASQAIRLAYTESRYAKLNFVSYFKYGTVEFRQHSGTIDAEKIKNWVRFCTRMVDLAYASPMPVPTPQPRAVPTTTMGVPTYWSRGRRRQVLYQMLTRSKGCTTEEVRVALNLNTQPSIRLHLENSGVQWVSNERRNGYNVFRIVGVSGPVAAATPTPSLWEPVEEATLDNLLDRLQLTPSERNYWVERAALLSPHS